MALVHNRSTYCGSCKMKYMSRCSINNHPREYGEPTEFHQCPQCPYKTGRKGNFTKHLRRKHGKPEKCNHCHKLFRSKYHLDNHTREKHGSTEYHCPDCDYVTCIQSKLDVHVKNFHTRWSQIQKFEFSDMIHSGTAKCLVRVACLWSKMPMFRRAGMREGG